MNKKIRMISMVLFALFVCALSGCNSPIGDKIAESYTVTFDANGGEGTMESMTFADLKSGYLPECTFLREGYEFEGWSLSKDGVSIYKPGDKLPVDQKTFTLYAIWSKTSGSVTVTVIQQADILIEKSIEGDVITLTASSDFTDYKWILDDASLDSTAATVSIDSAALVKGVHEVLVVAVKNGITYSSQINIVIQ